tara:strand:- start:31 stop:321 length:291 start_codon:yes stop_codon:yes gene_type:complete
MAIVKQGWLKEAIAKPDGYYTVKGERLKGANLSAEYIAEWNGESAPEQLNEAPADKSLDDMSKKELEALGRQHGIELDRRKNKNDLIEELTEHMES